MKSPVLFLLLTLVFSTVIAAQGQARIALDLRPGLSENSGLAEITRSRVVADDTVPSSASAAANLERKVFEVLNAVRRGQGLHDLQWNDDVAAVARMHSQNMANEK